MTQPEARADPRYGRYVGLLALLVVAAVTITLLVSKPTGIKGIEPGQQIPPFAVPLVTGNLPGDANVARGANEGDLGRVPACSVRGPEVLNVCQLYEHGPLVLALFVDGGSCPAVLSDMQSLAGSFPEVRFAAVSIMGDRRQLRALVRKRGLTFPVGIDSDGVLAGLYKLATCPQVTFALPGGVVQSPALLTHPPLATLRARVAELVAAAHAVRPKAASS